MADSTASIKSLYSGKAGFSDADLDDVSAISQNSFPLDGKVHGSDSRNFQDSFPISNPVTVSGVSAPGAPKSGLASKSEFQVPYPIHIAKPEPKALSPGPPDWYENRYSSTNISLASSLSEYQQGTKFEESGDYSEVECLPNDSYSRPLSRNSVTSGFSTTATKDGVEGKRPYRQVQKSLLGNVLAGKPQHVSGHHNQNYSHNLPVSGSTSPSVNSPAFGSAHDAPSMGLRQGLSAAGLPPISLDEKINLMNSESLLERK